MTWIPAAQSDFVSFEVKARIDPSAMHLSLAYTSLSALAAPEWIDRRTSSERQGYGVLYVVTYCVLQQLQPVSERLTGFWVAARPWVPSGLQVWACEDPSPSPTHGRRRSPWLMDSRAGRALAWNVQCTLWQLSERLQGASSFFRIEARSASLLLTHFGNEPRTWRVPAGHISLKSQGGHSSCSTSSATSSSKLLSTQL